MALRKEKVTKDAIKILFATDSGYFPHLAVAIQSLLENNQDFLIEIIVLTGTASIADQQNIVKITSKFDVSIEFKVLDDNYFKGLPLGHHFKKSNYYRLFAADVITDDRCLYLDADLVVRGSIKEIFDIELGRHYLAAVENPGFSRHSELGMNANSKYFNSGVMLLNLAVWRETDCRDEVVSFVRERADAIRFVDQCGLNGVIDGRWLELNSKYNCQSALDSGGYGGCSLEGEPVIVHFTGSGKPWHLNNRHPYKKLYWRYRNKTPYKSYFPDDFNLINVVRYILPSSFKYFIKKTFGIVAK